MAVAMVTLSRKHSRRAIFTDHMTEVA